MTTRLSKIAAKAIKTQYEHDGNYTKYTFKISTSFTHWTITKRYSDFEKVHKDLIRKHEDTMPLLPSKIFWKKNSEENVKKRSLDLEVYLNKALSQPLILFCIEFIHFICIEDDTLSLLRKTQSLFSSRDNKLIGNIYSISDLSYSYNTKPKPKAKSAVVDNTSSSGSKSNSSNTSSTITGSDNVYSELYLFNRRKSTMNQCDLGHSKIIEEFLIDLEENKENQVEIVNAFGEFFDDQTEEMFSTEEILLLLRGNKHQYVLRDFIMDNDNEERNKDNKEPINGLLYHIGNYSKNIFGSLACLQFLLNLMRCDKNYDSDRYVILLKSVETREIAMMKLNELIKSSHCVLAKKALQLIKVFINYQFEIEKVFNYNDYMFLLDELAKCE